MLKRWSVEMFIAHPNVTIKHLTRYKQKVVSAAMLEGKSMPSNMAANTNHATLVEKSKYQKMSPLNAFPLKFQL